MPSGVPLDGWLGGKGPLAKHKRARKNYATLHQPNMLRSLCFPTINIIKTEGGGGKKTNDGQIAMTP